MKKSWFYRVMHFYCQFFTCITQVPNLAELVKSLFFYMFLAYLYIHCSSSEYWSLFFMSFFAYFP